MAAINHSYFVIMVDYGRDTSKVHGFEAVVDPEMTFRGAVEKVRALIGDGKEIAFAHRINMGEPPIDVRDELIAEATALRMEAAE